MSAPNERKAGCEIGKTDSWDENHCDVQYYHPMGWEPIGKNILRLSNLEMKPMDEKYSSLFNRFYDDFVRTDEIELAK